MLRETNAKNHIEKCLKNEINTDILTFKLLTNYISRYIVVCSAKYLVLQCLNPKFLDRKMADLHKVKQ